ncbi:MAG: hypothetical protein JWP75_2510, partial [Frondihabitans sp.]|nr:hypothetical protein [Frondihabitans sp.]
TAVAGDAAEPADDRVAGFLAAGLLVFAAAGADVGFAAVVSVAGVRGAGVRGAGVRAAGDFEAADLAAVVVLAADVFAPDTFVPFAGPPAAGRVADERAEVARVDVPFAVAARGVDVRFAAGVSFEPPSVTTGSVSSVATGSVSAEAASAGSASPAVWPPFGSPSSALIWLTSSPSGIAATSRSSRGAVVVAASSPLGCWGSSP